MLLPITEMQHRVIWEEEDSDTVSNLRIQGWTVAATSSLHTLQATRHVTVMIKLQVHNSIISQTTGDK